MLIKKNKININETFLNFPEIQLINNDESCNNIYSIFCTTVSIFNVFEKF